ncbi:MAG TPA: alpha/beta hydrolase [Actinomycetes bacterium]|nr:alpha/beta hydrolase [Actinomycetes bacterium]
MTASSEVRGLSRPGGSVAYEVAGAGPLIVCVPGVGDLRASYRYLQPQLLAAGYRVAVMDLRGHGQSDATFAEYGDEATAGDIAALIAEMGGPAVIVGNSMAAGSAVLVAAQHPELASGLVLIGPFVRGPNMNPAMRMMIRVAMFPLWAAAFWKSYLPKLYAGTKPDDFADYREAVSAAMKRPGYAKSFSLTIRTRHDAAEEALGAVKVATVVVMGELDPDFPDPRAEADWIAEALHAEVVMVPETGHYPQSQSPQITTDAVLRLA